MHDIVEDGAICFLFDGILSSLTPSLITDINARIQAVNDQFSNDYLELKSFKIGKGTISGTAIQKLSFFNTFSIINTFLQPISLEFELFYMFRIITNFLFYPIVYREDLPFFKKLVNIFVKIFKTKFPRLARKFKIHFMLHYDELILIFGPLLFSSTLRYERCHQRLVRSVEGTRNFANFNRSLAKNFFFDISFLKNNLEFEKLKELKIESLDVEYQSYVNFLGRQTLILELKSIILDGKSLEFDCVYLFKEQHQLTGLPIFIKITKILKCDKKIFFFGRIMNAKSFDRILFSFSVVFDSNIIMFNPETIEFHEKLICFKTKPTDFYVIYTFHIKFSISDKYLKMYEKIKDESDIEYESDSE